MKELLVYYLPNNACKFFSNADKQETNYIWEHIFNAIQKVEFALGGC